jgi:hypothetical protein
MGFHDRKTAGPAPRKMVCVLTGALAAILAGCGERDIRQGLPLYAAKGKVLLADGKPLTAGRVVFVSAKPSITAVAKIEGDGGFAFKAASRDGLPAAEYKIRIESGASTASKGSGGKLVSSLPFATDYLDEDYSGLKATVTTDENNNNFELKLGTKSPTESTQRRGGK